jgi:DNA adenine methylase
MFMCVNYEYQIVLLYYYIIIKMNSNTQIILHKPFLKWAGGKTQIIRTIVSKFPKKMNNYHELFVGGGSVLLALLSLIKKNKINVKNNIYAYDLNMHLINVYKQVQTNKDKLYEYIKTYRNEYDNINTANGNRNPTTKKEAMLSKESYYYWQRKKYNTIKTNTVKHAALFIFLNKTGFRGMYREGPHGFNIPYGHYKKTPAIIDKDELDTISELIQQVTFIHCDFTISIKKCKIGDFVYMDPPYAPETKKSFVGYTKKGFILDMHKLLFEKKKNFIKRILNLP